MRGIRVHTSAFEAEVFRSGELGPLAAIVHPVTRAGRYEGLVYRDSQRLGSFLLTVDEEPSSGQVDIDLASFTAARRRVAEAEEMAFEAGQGAHVVLWTSRGRGGFWVTLTHTDDDSGRPGFDSRELNQGDHYSVTLVRPGRYRAVTGRHEASILVERPTPATRPAPPLEPARLVVGGDEIQPGEVRIRSGQGVVFSWKMAGSVEIRLEPRYRESEP